MKALVALRSKLLRPRRKLLFLRFTLKLRKPLRLLQCFRLRAKSSLKSLPLNSTFSPVSPHFLSRKMVRSVSDDEKKLFPSPVTPSYIKTFRAASRIGNRDACRSFEQYLAEMMVEDGKMRDDLTDAEELVHCWTNLKCPVFIDTVCRFYGELCEDLFAPGDANHVQTSSCSKH